MAIAFVQDSVAAGARDSSAASTLTVTFTKTTTAGNLLVMACGQTTVAASSIATDSRGNAWQLDKTSVGNGGMSANICSCLVTTPHQIGDTVVVTFTGSGSYAAAIVSEYSGIASSSWLDQTAAGNNAGGVPTTGVTSTRSQADELLYGVVAYNNASDSTVGTNYTLLTVKASGAGNRKVLPEYQIVSSVGTDAATWGGSQAYNSAIATYKMAAASGPPSNDVAPAVTGTAVVGQQLSCDDGTWTDDGNPTFTYQWQRDTNGDTSYSNIGSATANTYTLVDADDNCKIRCVVTDTDGNGNTSANSNATAQVDEPAPTNSAVPAVSGTMNVGQTLSTTTGTWAHMGGYSPSYAYKWQDSDDGSTGWADITGATSSTYTIEAGEENKYLRSVVTATNTGGAGTPANSTATAQIGAELAASPDVSVANIQTAQIYYFS